GRGGGRVATRRERAQLRLIDRIRLECNALGAVPRRNITGVSLPAVASQLALKCRAACPPLGQGGHSGRLVDRQLTIGDYTGPVARAVLRGEGVLSRAGEGRRGQREGVCERMNRVRD